MLNQGAYNKMNKIFSLDKKKFNQDENLFRFLFINVKY